MQTKYITIKPQHTHTNPFEPEKNSPKTSQNQTPPQQISDNNNKISYQSPIIPKITQTSPLNSPEKKNIMYEVTHIDPENQQYGIYQQKVAIEQKDMQIQSQREQIQQFQKQIQQILEKNSQIQQNLNKKEKEIQQFTLEIKILEKCNSDHKKQQEIILKELDQKNTKILQLQNQQQTNSKLEQQKETSKEKESDLQKTCKNQQNIITELEKQYLELYYIFEDCEKENESLKKQIQKHTLIQNSNNNNLKTNSNNKDFENQILNTQASSTDMDSQNHLQPITERSEEDAISTAKTTESLSHRIKQLESFRNVQYLSETARNKLESIEKKDQQIKELEEKLKQKKIKIQKLKEIIKQSLTQITELQTQNTNLKAQLEDSFLQPCQPLELSLINANTPQNDQKIKNISIQNCEIPININIPEKKSQIKKSSSLEKPKQAPIKKQQHKRQSSAFSRPQLSVQTDIKPNNQIQNMNISQNNSSKNLQKSHKRSSSTAKNSQNKPPVLQNNRQITPSKLNYSNIHSYGQQHKIKKDLQNTNKNDNNTNTIFKNNQQMKNSYYREKNSKNTPQNKYNNNKNIVIDNRKLNLNLNLNNSYNSLNTQTNDNLFDNDQNLKNYRSQQSLQEYSINNNIFNQKQTTNLNDMKFLEEQLDNDPEMKKRAVNYIQHMLISKGKQDIKDLPLNQQNVSELLQILKNQPQI